MASSSVADLSRAALLLRRQGSLGQSEDLLCSICQDIFDSPVTRDCGHTFCKNCIDTNPSDRCPLCREKNDSKKTSVNRVIQAMTERLPCRCPNADEDEEKSGNSSSRNGDGNALCLWTGTLGQLASHLIQCPAAVATCPFAVHGCTEVVRKYQLDAHNSAFAGQHSALLAGRIAAMEVGGSQGRRIVTWNIGSVKEKMAEKKDLYSDHFSVYFNGWAGGPFQMKLCVNFGVEERPSHTLAAYLRYESGPPGADLPELVIEGTKIELERGGDTARTTFISGSKVEKGKGWGNASFCADIRRGDIIKDNTITLTASILLTAPPATQTLETK